ncbi:MAG: PEP-CTERM sorting domain-containing protein [Pirellulaceae bacterium]|nr:PEP-CTERM sorting domain-containing protein [Pirellulaceae bacterium]
MHIRSCVLYFAAMTMTGTTFAEEPFFISEAPKTSPTIDGVVDPHEWTGNALPMSWAHNERTKADSAPLEIEIQYAWDNENFYVLVQEIADDDPTGGYNASNWCGECVWNGEVPDGGYNGNGPAPWSTDSIGFYDKGIKWPGTDPDDATAATTQEIGPWSQFWVALVPEADLPLTDPQPFHMVRTTNDQLNEGGTGVLIGPEYEENFGSVPLIPDLDAPDKAQAAHGIDKQGRRVTEFLMRWDQIRYDLNDERAEVQDRIEQLNDFDALDGHFLQDVEAGYEFRLDPFLVDGVDNQSHPDAPFSWGSQTAPSGIEFDSAVQTFADASIVRLLDNPLARLDDDSLTNLQQRADYVHNVLGTWIGDSNLDGEFNSTDFVSVFQQGQYEDGIDGNSSWITGDWNGDHEFNSSDFVFAFQDSGFEAGPRPQIQAVPEPAGYLMLLLGLSGLSGIRSRKS